MQSSEKRVILITGIAHAMTHGYMLIFPAVLSAIKADMDVGYFSIGILGIVHTFLSAWERSLHG